MAGEYYRWLARDVKPEEKRELTREEKVRNWWYYHKWHLLIAAVMVFVVADIASDILHDYRNQPDYSIAYVGSSYLPDDTVAQLTDALGEMGEDLNGNGSVDVQLHQYIAYLPETSDQPESSSVYTMLYTAQVQLAADIENCSSFFFLLENPRLFQEDYQILIHLDGSYPDDMTGDSPLLYRMWSDCPVLTALPLGNFTVESIDSIYTGASQDILAGLYIGRRGFWDGTFCENYEDCEALWNQLIRGAEN